MYTLKERQKQEADYASNKIQQQQPEEQREQYEKECKEENRKRFICIIDDDDFYEDDTSISDKEWFKLDTEQDLLGEQQEGMIRN